MGYRRNSQVRKVHFCVHLYHMFDSLSNDPFQQAIHQFNISIIFGWPNVSATYCLVSFIAWMNRENICLLWFPGQSCLTFSSKPYFLTLIKLCCILFWLPCCITTISYGFFYWGYFWLDFFFCVVISSWFIWHYGLSSWSWTEKKPILKCNSLFCLYWLPNVQ